MVQPGSMVTATRGGPLPGNRVVPLLHDGGIVQPMGLGTSYPASGGGTPPRPSPGQNGGPDRTSGPPPRTGSRAYSQSYPENTPSWYQEGRITPSSLAPMDPLTQAMSDFEAINRGQADNLQAQYLNSLGLGQLGYDNETWFRQVQAQNDLARLGLAEGREVGLGRERNANDRQFAGRAFEIDSRGNALKRDMGYRANDSEAAGRGSITSFGYGQNARDILGQFGIAQDTTQLTYDKKMADLAIDDKALDSLASEYGLKRDDINNALKYGLTQLGLDWTQTVDQLNRQLASGNDQLAMNAINFMNQIMSIPLDSVAISDLNLPVMQMPGQPLELGPASLAYLEEQKNKAGAGGGTAGGGGGGGPQRVLYM